MKSDIEHLAQHVGTIKVPPNYTLDFYNLTKRVKRKAKAYSTQHTLCVIWLSAEPPDFYIDDLNELEMADIWKVCGRTAVRDGTPILEDSEYIKAPANYSFYKTYKSFRKLFEDFA